LQYNLIDDIKDGQLIILMRGKQLSSLWLCYADGSSMMIVNCGAIVDVLSGGVQQ